MRPLRCYCGHAKRTHGPLEGSENFPMVCNAKAKRKGDMGCPCCDYEADPDGGEA